jgi:hypothetical protein
MIRSPSFSFSLFVGIMSLLIMLAVGSNNGHFSLTSAEEEQQDYQLLQSISSSSHDKSDHDLYYGAAFIKELENLVKNLNIHLTLKEAKFFQIIT